MKFTFFQYTENPFGKANGVFTHRQMYKNMYTEKFNKINLREAGKITYHCYNEESTGRYFIYVKMPSEVVKNFYYDTVIEFYPSSKTSSLDASLNNYYVRFYSNDPSFVYTYAYAFNKHDCFIKELAPKMSKRALTDKALEKNPNNLVGYVKSIYFTFIFMKSKNLFYKTRFMMDAQPINFKNLLSMIEHADKKIADREEKGKIQKEKDKKQKQEFRERVINDTSAKNRTVRNKVVNTVKATKNTLSSSRSSVKKSKTTKKI